jgi:hypothetical protein
VRHLFFLVICSSVLCCRSAVAFDKSAAPAQVNAAIEGVDSTLLRVAQCPQTWDEWRAWRTKELTTLAQSHYKKNIVYISSVLKQCAAQMNQIVGGSGCFKNLNRFINRLDLSKRPGHLLGFDMPDSEYLDLLSSRGYLSLPPNLARQELLADIDNTRFVDFAKIEDKIRSYDPKWRVFYYKSRNLSTPDDSQAMGRLLVYVPGDVSDRFIQFGVSDADSSKPSEVISQIIVEKLDPVSGKAHADPQVYYVDLWRSRNSGSISVTSRLQSVKTAEPCYSCHESTLIKIKPADHSILSDVSSQQLADVNSVISRYASAKIAEFNDDDLGPSVGSKFKTVDAAQHWQVLKQNCGVEQLKDDASVERVHAAMDCSRCHDGSSRAAIHYLSVVPDQFPTGSNLVKQAIIQDAVMPPKSDLTADENTVLYQCLSKSVSSPSDLSGELERWLLQIDCTPDT